MTGSMSDDLRSGALVYHAHPKAGKLEIRPTKPLGNQRDLALAYSPGVAAACDAIVADPNEADRLTIRQNLVAVITNGTAVLGLGPIGPLAAKPVMEGKAVLFKKFAGLDVFDIEIAENDPQKLIEIIASLEPTFGGINLEDIKAPECFIVEAALKGRMKIPVFHDDQHGTAIIVAAAVQNAVLLTGKSIDKVKIVTSGAGAAALACLDMLVLLGVKRENIWISDIEGVVYEGREALMDPWKERFAQRTTARSLADIMDGADIFLGLSAAGVLKADLLKKMGEKPLIMALANPVPEIMPEEARLVRPDAMLCTGRSDFPNQVNNVLCFPYIFRGALDCGATTINEAMKLAAVKAIAELARETPSEMVGKAYGGETRQFGVDQLIPSPFDPRLILRIAPAVVLAAMETGVARHPIDNMDDYEERLERFVFRSGFVMKPLFTAARTSPKRVVYADGEDERVLRATQVVVEEGLARPILIGRPHVIESRIQRFGLSVETGRDFDLINPEDDPRYRDYWTLYHDLAGRRGITPDAARAIVRTRPTVIAALAIRRGEADAMLCGLEGRFDRHMNHIEDIIGFADGVSRYSAMSLLILDRGAYFIADTHVNVEPSASDLADMTLHCAEHVRRFGLKPRIALVTASDFGSLDTPSAQKMREALAIILQKEPELEVDGEMQGDTALSSVLREKVLSGSRLKGEANVLVMPNLDSANIAFQTIKVLADALPVGPVLMGTAYPAHVLTPTVTARGVVNMTALAVAEAVAKTQFR
jgi:malate dehydrogenase (oxaloacetate-decarboxylating)(NADP+)